MNDTEGASLRKAIEAYYADPEQQAQHARALAEADRKRHSRPKGPPWAIVTYAPGEPGRIACPVCGLLVAQLPLSPDGEVAGQINLVAGFANANRRHASGLPWFVRAEWPTKPSPPIRPVVVVTCTCGSDCRIPQVTQAFTDLVGDRIRNDPSHPQHRLWAERPIDWRNRE